MKTHLLVIIAFFTLNTQLVNAQTTNPNSSEVIGEKDNDVNNVYNEKDNLTEAQKQYRKNKEDFGNDQSRLQKMVQDAEADKNYSLAIKYLEEKISTGKNSTYYKSLDKPSQSEFFTFEYSQIRKFKRSVESPINENNETKKITINNSSSNSTSNNNSTYNSSNTEESIYQKRQREAEEREKREAAAERKRINDGLARLEQQKRNNQSKIDNLDNLEKGINNTIDNMFQGANEQAARDKANREAYYAREEAERKRKVRERAEYQIKKEKEEAEIQRKEKEWAEKELTQSAQSYYFGKNNDQKMPLIVTHYNVFFFMIVQDPYNNEIQFAPFSLKANSAKQLPYKNKVTADFIKKTKTKTPKLQGPYKTKQEQLHAINKLKEEAINIEITVLGDINYQFVQNNLDQTSMNNSSTKINNSSKVLSDNYFIKAQEYYSNGDKGNALLNLDKCVESLGQTKIEIEALYVYLKVYEKYALQREKHLQNFLKSAKKNHSDYADILLMSEKITKEAAKYNRIVKTQLADNQGRSWEKQGPLLIKSYGYFNKSGQLAIPINHSYGKLWPFYDGVAIVRLNENTGVYDESISYAGSTIVSRKRKERTEVYALIDESGSRLTQKRYTKIYRLQNGTLVFKDFNYELDNPLGILSKNGNEIAHSFSSINLSGSDNICLIQQKKLGVEYRTYDDGSYGLVDVSGNLILEPKFKKIEKFKEELACVYNGENTFYINSSGGKKIELKGIKGSSFSGGLAIIKKDNKYGYINKSGKVVVDFFLSQANSFFDGYAFARYNDKKIVVTTDGTILFSFDNKYKIQSGIGWSWSQSKFSGDKAIIQDDENRFYLISRTGEISLIPIACSRAHITNKKGIFKLTLKGDNSPNNLALINTDMKVITQQNYYHINKFNNGLAIVEIKKGDKYLTGYIDIHGNEVIPLIYKKAEPFTKEGIALVTKDYNTYEKIKPLLKKYQGNKSFNDGLRAVYQVGLYGFIDESDNIIIPLEYDDVWSYKDQTAIVLKNNKYGMINKTNTQILEIKYDSIWRYSNSDIIGYKLEGKIGISNTNGKIIYPNKFDKIDTAIVNNTLSYWLNRKRGVIDIFGKEVLPPIYFNLAPISETMYVYYLLNEDGIDKGGLMTNDFNRITPPKYGFIYFISRESNLLAYQLVYGGKQGVVNNKGIEITKAIYDKVEADKQIIKHGFLTVFQGEKQGVIDLKGNQIVPFLQSKADFNDSGVYFIAYGYTNKNKYKSFKIFTNGNIVDYDKEKPYKFNDSGQFEKIK